MGNCLPFLRLARNKYQENLETPSQKQEGIQLLSDEYISNLCSCTEDFWAISQESSVSVYLDWKIIENWQCSERVRAMSTSKTQLYTGGKNIEVFSHSGKLIGTLSGHERPTNALSSRNNFLLSGSSDWTMRLWDLSTHQEIRKSLINWNVITSIKWLDEYTAVQTSEDLRLRVWDIRGKSLKNSEGFLIGDNFATCCDCKDFFVVTGHRGFSGNGCEVKMWDIRMNSIIFCNKAHEQPVESVKFVNEEIVSCGKDGKIVKYEQTGKETEKWCHSAGKPIVALDLFKNGLLAATIDPSVLAFSFTPLANLF